MKICQNCGSQLTCSCQERVASNGKECCGNCIVAYENGLNAVNNPEPINLNENFTSQ